jgi:hypothetical protein
LLFTETNISLLCGHVNAAFALFFEQKLPRDTVTEKHRIFGYTKAMKRGRSSENAA